MPKKVVYEHYATIGGVQYPFFYSNSPVINPKDFLHPYDDTFYVFDMEPPTKDHQVIDGFTIIPKEEVTCIGAKPYE